ncbi:MAG: nucleoside triphosphate pyrophosphohydrolase family protein [Candidatus Colwellbacteria bacterium]|nr:nucleoside triphosphate pyrophosphohydrolase family protein [Candidatus Colwellbacteria bacterium]
MTFDDCQKRARACVVCPRVGENFVYPSLGLANEAGEVAGEVKRRLRDDGEVVTGERREKIKAELGNLLWCLSQLAAELGISPDAVAENNIEKLSSRKERGVLRGSGENR